VHGAAEVQCGGSRIQVRREKGSNEFQCHIVVNERGRSPQREVIGAAMAEERMLVRIA